MTDITPMGDDELLALWERGRRMALRHCAGTLRALRTGRGGFYDADDFWQDLFLDFYDLVGQWWAGPEPRCSDDLWVAWRRRLWQGGSRVLHRRPQRLWRRNELAIDPGELDPTTDLCAGHAVLGASCEALVDAEGPAGRHEAHVAAELAVRRLWNLDPTSRQALYLTAVAGLSGAEAARCLNLPNGASVQVRVHRARRALRARVSEEGNAGEGGMAP